MFVKDLLESKTSQDVATASAQDSVSEASHLLSEWRIGALVIVDDSRRIVGILSERDIVRGLARHGADVLSLKVGQLMTADVVVCGLGDDIPSLMETMTARRIRHLPVVEHGKLAGIITIGDVVKSRLAEVTIEVEQIREYVTHP